MIEKLKNRRNLAILIAAAVVVVAIVVVVLVCVLTGDSPAEPVDGPSSSTTSTTTPPTTAPTTPEPEPPGSVVPENGMVDEVESIGDWMGTGVALHMESAPVGSAWLAAEQQDQAGASLLFRSFVPALDLTSYSNGYLHMWIYVEDITRVLDGQVELTSSGNCDDRELSWNILQYAKKSGWNEVYLPFGSANKVGGDMDLAACNFMRVYIVTDGNCVLGIDSLQLTNDSPPPPSRVDANGEFVIDEVESLASWYGTPWELLRDGAPRGNAYLSSTTRDGDAYVLCQDLAPMDIREYQNGYLHVWLYVEDIGHLVSGEVELSSAGVSDTNETSWDLLNYVTQNGWNELYLPLSDAKEVGGSTDFSAVNYIRIYFVTDADTTVGVDYISLSKTDGSGEGPVDPVDPDEPTLDTGDLDEQGEFVLDTVEKLAPWQGRGLTVIREGQAKGNAYLGSQLLDGDAILFARGFSDLDIRKYQNGYLHMWLYISDIDQITGGQIELCSGNEADSGETSWNMLEIDLKNGWNELYLPISQSQQVGGGTDFSKLNYMRVYVLSKQEQLVGLDYITLTTTAPEKPDPVDPDGNYILDPIRSVYPWQGSPMVFHTAGGFEDGAIWISSTRQEAGDIEFFRTFLPMDLSAYQNGSLHLWVYVDDLSKVTGGMVEITSSGTVDNAEISWQLKPYLKQSGWNEVYLPITEGVPEGEDAFDISAVNAMRVVVGTGSSITAGIDEIYASHTIPEPPEEEPGMLDPVDSLGPWSGTELTLETAGGHAADADWISGSVAGAGDVFFFRNFSPAKDLSEFADGSLHLWVYVDDLSKVTGGMVEITSSGTVDNAEISWPLKSYLEQSGWNELYLPIADGVPEGEDAFDITAVNCIRVVVMRSEAGEAGIDEIYASDFVPDPGDDDDDEDPGMLDPVDSLGPWSGSELTLETAGGHAADADWISGSVAGAGDVFFFRNLAPAKDLSEFADGSLHLWVYVDDLSKVTGGMVEITSSGTVDNAEISWPIRSYLTQDGWNEVLLPVADGVPQGEDAFDITAVDCIRVVVMLSEAGEAGIDEISMTTELPEIDTGAYDEAVEEAYQRSLLYLGADNNQAAIAAVLEKAQNGDPVTLVTLGDSITAGAVAASGNEWAALVRDWLEGLDGDAENGNVTLINAGIGSTEGVFGVTRLERDVLSHDPDLVIVDFGTNDYGLPYGPEAYEGILSKLLKAGIPTINSNVCPENGNNIQDSQTAINEAYGVPQISFRSAYYEFSLTTDIVGLRDFDIWSSDHVHPTDQGHKLLAELLIQYMQREILDKNVQPGQQDTTLPESVTDNGFDDAVLVENFTETEHAQVSMDGWTDDYSARIYQLSTEGWQTSTVGSSLTFDVDGGYFYLFFALTPESGDLEIRVDGVLRQTIDWAYLGTGYMNVQHVLHLGAAGEHQVVLTLKDNPNVENDWFGICAAGVSNFDGVEEPLPATLPLDPVENTASWFGDKPLVIETADGPTADWMSTTRNAAGDAVFCRGFASTDISGYDYLHVWVYIPDLDTATQAYLELSSNGGNLVNRTIRWNVLSYANQDGWNELYLPLAEAEAVGMESFTPLALDLMRLYVGLPDDTAKAGIDDLYMTNERPEPEPPVEETLPLDPVTEIGLWNGSAMTLETTGGHTEGADWLKAAVEAGDIVFSRPFNPTDISAYDYLHLWVYVDDISQLTGGMIEITSSGTVDEEELYWNLTDYVTQSGWNELYLPLDAALAQGTRPFVSTNFNCIRMVVMHSGPIVAGVDDLYMTNERPEPEPPVEEPLVLDPVTEIGLWNGSAMTLETAGGHTEGADWLKAAVEAGDIVFSRPFNPTDISAYDYLHLWVYVDDISQLTGGMIEITSSGVVDEEELYWNLTDYVTQSGWNELYLPLDAALAQGTRPFVSTNFNCIRMVVMHSGPIAAGVDDLYLTNERPEPEPPVEEPLVLDPVTDSTAWFGDKPFVIETADGPTADWMSTTRNAAGDAVFCRGFSAVDISGYDYLHVWVYIPDLDTATQAWLEFSSNGGALVNYTIRWNVLNYANQDGWNELYLPIAEAEAVGANAFDPTALDMMRLYVGLPDDTAKAGIDDLYMTNERPEPEPPVEEPLVLDPVTDSTAWFGDKPFVIETADGPTADWMSTTRNAFGDAVFCRGFSAVDISGYDYLHVWVYIPDLDAATQAWLEFSSNGGALVNYTIRWNVLNYANQDGWNELYLPLAEAEAVGANAFDPTALDMMRLYVGLPDDTAKAGIDDLYMTSERPESEPPVKQPLVLDPVTEIGSWIGSAMTLETTGGHTEGADWLKVVSEAGDIVFMRAFTPTDLSAYMDGYLHLWVYVDDVSQLTGGMIEIASSGTVDEEELYWNLTDYVTQSGWNELYLPLNAALAQGTRPFVPTNFNCIRIVVMHSGPIVAGIDDLSATGPNGPAQTAALAAFVPDRRQVDFWGDTDPLFLPEIV